MSKKIFAIISNLNVVQLKTEDATNIENFAGLLISEESNRSFTPNYFSKAKTGSTVKLWNHSLKKPIAINNSISLVTLVERVDSKADRWYYREIVFSIRDIVGDTRACEFYLKPEATVDAEFLKESLDKLKTSTVGFNTVKEVVLQEKLVSLNNEINSLKHKVEKLQEEIKKQN